MRIHYLRLSAVFVGLLFAVAAQSQSWTRPPGWEFRADLLYQNQKDVHTNGCSDVALDTSWGGSLGVAYRFNPYLETHFLLDLQSINYDARVVRADVPNVSANVSDKLSIYTPRAVGVLNFLDHPITPYVSAGIGWSFINTNIPTSTRQVGCWWDPWYGYVCAPYQSTYSNNR